jgi:AraC-like DNA-binding protein
VQVVKILIEDNFHLPLDLSEMARSVNLSPWRLAHIFKAEVGISPLRYLALVRLQKARYYLETGFLTVREIGASVGFPNASHFTRSFKAAYGSSPVQHRSSNFRVSSVRDNVDPLNSPSGARQKKAAIDRPSREKNRRN